ncbi:MAG: ATP-binding protein [Pseudomonadota bacterium]
MLRSFSGIRHYLGQALANLMPKGLYARVLLIIVVPIVILQSVIAFVFMERHWETVTQRLSAAVTRDIATLIELYDAYPSDQDFEVLRRIAFEELNLNVALLPPDPLPSPANRPFFSILDEALSAEIRNRIDRPFWIDTVGRSNIVEIRVELDDAVLRVFARRGQAYASNSHIFIVWMVGTSLVLLLVAVSFMRNQIRPILQLADAAEGFGKGHPVPEGFRPRGAREVRRASRAFVEMRSRIERQMEQRTAMLAGVSHDLRTILTRFKLQLALLGGKNDTEELEADITEMQNMLQAYLDFARGDAEEEIVHVNLAELFDQLAVDGERSGRNAQYSLEGDKHATLRPNAIKRCLTNLINNAHRHGDTVQVHAEHRGTWLIVTVDDDGPGIPPESREEVFRPFFRLDDARNQDEAGTGLGLAIARDIARSHGGDITLSDSAMGGLRARLSLPV